MALRGSCKTGPGMGLSPDSVCDEICRPTPRQSVEGHGRGNYADHTLKLTFPRNPNGLYLLKGGGPDVWQAFGVPMSWRKRQGLIAGKRCGTTENIGPAARHRWRNRLHRVKQAAVQT